jgi:hypothetical protein
MTSTHNDGERRGALRGSAPQRGKRKPAAGGWSGGETSPAGLILDGERAKRQPSTFEHTDEGKRVTLSSAWVNSRLEFSKYTIFMVLQHMDNCIFFVKILMIQMGSQQLSKRTTDQRFDDICTVEFTHFNSGMFVHCCRFMFMWVHEHNMFFKKVLNLIEKGDCRNGKKRTAIPLIFIDNYNYGSKEYP